MTNTAIPAGGAVRAWAIGLAGCVTVAMSLFAFNHPHAPEDIVRKDDASSSRATGASQIMSRPSLAEATAVPGTPGSRHFSGMGLNLGSFDYWSTDFPTIDQFKRASPWITSNGNTWDTGEEGKLDLDANGWVKSLPAANDTNVRYRHVVAVLFQGDGGAHPGGVYTVLYDGAGTIEYGGVSVVSRETGKDLVDVPGAGGTSMTINIKATTPGNHIRNIRVIPPGGICSLAQRVHVRSAADCAANGTGQYTSLLTLSEVQKQAWFPNFLGDLAGVRTLRFMDWGRTNSSTLSKWADRPKWDDATWTGSHGVPVGAMIQLANAVKADAWINLPTRVDDDYARRFAQTAKANLHPAAKLVLEYTNEPWNTFGPFYANYKWQLDRASEPGAFGTPPRGREFEWEQNWHAFRAASLCDIVKAEFGADAGRVQCVVNTQAGGGWWNALDYSLKCPLALEKRGGRPCADSFDAVAIAPYFGGYIGNPDGNTYRIHKHILDNWMTQGDGGIAKLFEELRARDAADQPLAKTPLSDLVKTGQPDAVGGALAQSRGWMNQYASFIANNANLRYRKPIFAYEGGQHMIQSFYTCKGADHPDPDPADCPQVEAEFRRKWQPLLVAANRHERMGKTYQEMMLDWRASGGQVFTQFNFVQAYSISGTWGLKESLFSPLDRSPKWRSMLPYRDSIPCWWGNGCEL